MKKVVISCGPIPARVDSVKFLTNRFKGGLAFKTAEHMIDSGKYDVTIVKWAHTELPKHNGQHTEYWMADGVHVVSVQDVFDYYAWFKNNAVNYDAFIMAAAVANLTPSHPYEGKFPSHKYRVGEKFNIEFEIAPRAIDIVKQVNHRCCLIGYKLFDAFNDVELIDIARHTLHDSKANIIFANTPAEAKTRKIAVMQDNTTLACSFHEHLELIEQAIDNVYFKTQVEELTQEEACEVNIREAIATVKMFEQTFPGHGTVAVPIIDGPFGGRDYFVTTARGHAGEPVLVRSVYIDDLTIHASGKATLNAPTLAAALMSAPRESIVVHRHDNDPLFSREPVDKEINVYTFPGSYAEANTIRAIFNLGIAKTSVKLFGHGDLRILPIRLIDWARYYEDFPERYFSAPEAIDEAVRTCEGSETLEIGCNKRACTKYAYDPFVKADNAINLTYKEVARKKFDLVVIKNAINYLSPQELYYLGVNPETAAKKFIANTFRAAPEERIRENEAIIKDTLPEPAKRGSGIPETLWLKMIRHTLRLKDDSIMRHVFHDYTEADFHYFGFNTKPYGENSMLVF